jgi:hypothetical protein
MQDWREIVSGEILSGVRGDTFWETKLSKCLDDELDETGLHLAVFTEPFLTFILEGKKRVESRFGVRRIAPYGRTAPGDIVLMKRSGGPVVGICVVSSVWYYRLQSGSWEKLRKEYSEALCADDPSFWEARRAACFATLMEIESPRAIQPTTIRKSDRRGWAVLRSPLVQNAHVWLSA